MAGVVLLYLGLIFVLGGVALLLTRWRWRHHLLLAGIGTVVIGALFPTRESKVTEPRTRLDQLAPAWQFQEIHQVRTGVSCAKAWTAIKDVTAGEVRFFRLLTWIRRFGRPGPESILNPPAGVPILEVATRTGFRRLAEEAEREIVVGVVVIPPDAARAFMNFRVTDAGTGGCVVTTETRVDATEGSARRHFAMYWRVIYPGSAMIRRMWLRALKERAERGEMIGTPDTY